MNREELIVEEYKSLRAEQVARMNHRARLITASITSSGALLGFGLGTEVGILLIVPIISSIFGYLILASTTQIADIGVYIKEFIERRLNQHHEFSMGWHLSQPKRQSRFWKLFSIWHLPMILTSFAPSLFALIAFFFKYTESIDLGIVLLVILDVVLIGYYVLAYVWNMHKGITPRGSSIEEWIERVSEAERKVTMENEGT